MAIRRIIFLAALLSGPVSSVSGEDLIVKLEYLGPKESSPFIPQLFLKVTNESFTNVVLIDKMQASELLVDGRSYRATSPFKGPPGLAPKSSWEGCVSLETYQAESLVPGEHRLRLKIGYYVTEEIRARVAPVENPAVTPAARLKQAKTLKGVLVRGLLKSCTENWLTEQDGGLQTLDQTRYYLDPDVKVIVSYSEERPEPKVKSPLRLYNEARIQD